METSLDQVPHHPLEKGFHTPLDYPDIFVDGCVQIWPDTDFTRLNTYGCTAYCVTTFRPLGDAGHAMDAIADWHRIAATYSQVRIATTAADIVAAKRENQAAIVLASQGGDFLAQNVYRLELFHRLGLRMMIPAYNSRSALGDGLNEPGNAGLSKLGESWVAECNRVGMLIDLTHVGERTTLDILERTGKPVVFSHSNPRGVVESPRNISDEQIKKCASTGGVVCVTNWGPLNFKAGSTTRPTLDDFLDAVAYTKDLVGGDHVGIGTDMSHGTYPDGDVVRGFTSSAYGSGYGGLVEASPRSRLRYVEGFDDYGQLSTVVDAMARRGHSDEDIRKILAGNMLRVFEQVWGG